MQYEILSKGYFKHPSDNSYWRNNLVCEIGNKNFSYKRHLSRHHLIDTGDKSYKCETLSEKICLNCDLSRYLLIYSNEKSFLCHKNIHKLVTEIFIFPTMICCLLLYNFNTPCVYEFSYFVLLRKWNLLPNIAVMK